MFKMFKKEDKLGLDHDDHEAVLDPQELPEYDHSGFEWEVEDED